jgi:hypothetical protein
MKKSSFFMFDLVDVESLRSKATKRERKGTIYIL